MKQDSNTTLLKTIIFTLLCLFAIQSASADWAADGWPYRMNVTFDSSPVSSPQTDYPLLVDITSTDLAAHADTDGHDIRFFIGGVAVPHEIESYESGHLIAWVKVPVLSDSSDLVLEMYYGRKSAPDQQDPAAVWDADYLGVYHLSEDANPILDSTSNDNDGAGLNNPNLAVDGIIDGADEFTGSQRTQLAQVFSSESAFTIEGWVYAEDDRGYAISQWSNNQGAFIQYFGTADEFQLYVNGNTAKVPAAPNMWHYVVGVFDGSEATLYVDAAVASTVFASLSWPAQNTYIGDRSTFDRGFEGKVDELRLSGTVRDEQYMITNYNVQSTPASFYTLAPEEFGSFPPEILALSPVDEAIDVPINPTLEIVINDPDGDLIEWTVQQYYENELNPWVVIATGSDPDGVGSVFVPTTTMGNYETEYSWRVSITDPDGSGDTIEEFMSFTTRLEQNYAPAFLEVFPADEEMDVTQNPTLTARIFDLDGNSVDWSVEVDDGLGFTELASGTEADGDVIVSVPTTTLTGFSTAYAWRLTAIDPSGTNTAVSETYDFTTVPDNYPAEITSAFPADGATDVEINPALGAFITDVEGNSIAWTVELWNGATWDLVESGSDVADFNLEALTSTITEYETEYTWRLTINDTDGSEEVVQEVFTFTTRAESYLPTITDLFPADNSKGTEENLMLSAYVEDLGGDLLDITFSLWNGVSYEIIETYNNVPSGVFTADTTGLTNDPVTQYMWKVTADDNDGNVVEEIAVFTTGGALELKWETMVTKSGDGIYGQIHPVMGDIDSDGDNEIVAAIGDNIVAINGKTGAVEWSTPGATSIGSAVELVDLDNDGEPEVLHGAPGSRITALDGDGSQIWSTDVAGESQAMFPIMAYDIDGDGYPTIYYATEDNYPTQWSGDINDYTGALTMLDHEGNILASTWLYHPCWGGISMGDANFDGVFEVYVSDRRGPYNGGVPSQGIQAYNAHTLEFMWGRPDIFSSSPMGVLADVVGDEDLELVAFNIVNRGPGVLDAQTGETILDYFNERLRGHATGTVYDIDYDGNMEIINAVSDNGNYPQDFVVFDLIDGTLDFNPSYEEDDFWVSWPPEVGDVTGDGYMEILAATGTQGSTGDYPFILYDKDFDQIDRIEIEDAGQLMPARLYDTDSDGLQELVLAGFNGKIMVYDTYAPVPNPAPRTWLQRYSEYRRGAAEYVELPGPKAPVVQSVFPADEAAGVSLSPTLSAKVYDFQKDSMDIAFEIYYGFEWITLETHEDVPAGEYTADTTGYAEDYNTEFKWRVVLTDAQGYSSSEEFTFTTVGSSSWLPSDWTYRKEIVIDKDMVEGPLTSYPLLIDITDSDLDLHAKADGSDIMFTKQDGFTPLSHEMEKYEDGRLVVWVKIDTLSDSMDTSIFMYYGNPSASGLEDVEGVWDDDYLAVHHLEESANPLSDSTQYNNDGTAVNGPGLAMESVINGGTYFDGVNDRVQLPQVFTNHGSFTFETWIYPEDKRGYAISQWSNNDGSFIQFFPPESNFQFYVNDATLKVPATPYTWHYLVGTFDGTTMSFSIDGGTPVTTSASLDWPAQNLYFGDRSTFDRQYRGMLDEMRISRVARSNDYIKTAYNNMNNPSSFMLVKSQETQGATTTKPLIFGESPAHKATAVPVGITELTFEVFDADPLSYGVVTFPDIGSVNGSGATSGELSVPVSGLDYNSEYVWQITVSDGSETTYKELSFSTEYLLDITTEGSGTVEADAPAPYSKDQIVTLTASADSGWTFIGWVGDVVSNDAQIVVTMDDAKTLVARFRFETGELIADSEFEDSYDSLQLREDSPWQDWFESRNDDPTIATLDETDIGGNTGKKLKFENNPYDNAYISQEFLTPITGTFDIQWDVYVENIHTDQAAIMMIGDNEPPSTSGPNYNAIRNWAWLAFTKEGGAETGPVELSVRDRSGATIVVMDDITLDEWHTLRVSGDVVADTYDLFVDGTPVAFDITSRTAKDALTYISFAQWNDGAGEFYIDNVREVVIDTCVDADGDGFSITGNICGPIDCNDEDASINPGAEEICTDMVDNNCNFIIDGDELICYGDTILTDNYFDESENDTDLRENKIGQDWYESRNDEPTQVSLDMSPLAGNDGPKVKVTGTELGDMYLTQEFNGPQSGLLSVQWDIYVDEIFDIDGNPDRSGWTMIGDDSTPDGSPNQLNSERFVMLGFAKEGGATSGTMNLVVRDVNDGWTSFTTVAANITLDEWHTIRTDLDFDADTYDIYVDDVMVGTVSAKTPKDAVTHISFVNMYDGAGIYYIDNVIASESCVDTDGDGFNSTGGMCGIPDCDDSDATSYPGATEVEDGSDNDCDGLVDEGFSVAFPDWEYRLELVVDRTQVEDDFSAFPVLVDIDSVDLNMHAREDGADILFALPNGTLLPYEIESYADGHVIAWVSLDISDSSDTSFYMYFGNDAGTTMEDPMSVWDGNYLAVHHLEETSGTAQDSTGNDNDGTPLNGVSQTETGFINGAYGFDGSNDRVALSQLYSGADGFTFEGWMYAGPKHGYALSQWNSNQGAFIQYFPNSANYQLYVDGTSIASPAVSEGWHYVTATHSGTSMILYIDGQQAVTGTSGITWPAIPTYLGDRFALGRAYMGTLDEVRFSDIARSAAYIETNYNNMMRDDFVEIASEEVVCVDEDDDGFSSIGGDCGPIDCNDADVTIYPGASEMCDGKDNDCDLIVDEDGDMSFYNDSDGDGYGDAAVEALGCVAPEGYVSNDLDCNDADASINPAAAEICDGIDQNCNALIDDGAESTYYADADNDTYGTTADTVLACTAPEGYVSNGLDCNDADASINPAAAEICDGIDQDCNALIDDGATTEYYADADNDTYGDAATTTDACALPEGYVENDLDCNDADASINPDASEVCDGIDNNCDASIDEGLLIMFYADADNDTYGDASVSDESCVVPAGYVENDLDCNDADASINPDASEVCDGIDNNCDASIDEGLLIMSYADADNDTYGDASVPDESCVVPAGYVENDLDCNDADGSINPDASEVCDGIDNNCDASVDEGLLMSVYIDSDLDGHGDQFAPEEFMCSVDPGYSESNDDCDDGDATVSPSEAEICGDFIDNNCDGLVDEGCPEE